MTGGSGRATSRWRRAETGRSAISLAVAPARRALVTGTEERGYHRMAAVLREVQAGDAADGAEVALGMLKLLTLARDAG